MEGSAAGSVAQDSAAYWSRFEASAIPGKAALHGTFLEALSKVQAGGRVLDLGCGDGRIAAELAERLPGLTFVGVDINAGAVEAAQARAAAAGVGLGGLRKLEFRVGDVTEAPPDGDGGAFDAVLVQCVLSVCGGPAQRRGLLCAARAWLRPGGRVLVSASGASEDINEQYAELYRKDQQLTGEYRTYCSRNSSGEVLYVTHHFAEEELQGLVEAAELNVLSLAREKEASTRRPDQAAWFLYCVAAREDAPERAAKRARPGAVATKDAPFPLLDITSPQTLEWCRSLPPPPADFAEDIFVCSYPKSGTTWAQHIVGSLILRALGGSGQGEGHVSARTPFLEVDPHWAGPGELAPSVVAGHRKIGRRMFNTHLRWEMMPKHDRARYIYICREGRDTCCSFFHHLSNQKKKAGDGVVFEGSFADFHARWLDGRIEFGRWSDHLLSWDAAAGDPRVLFLSYEEMTRDIRGCVERVARHLALPLGSSDFDELVPTFSFEHMKANRDQFQPVSVQWKDGFDFIRKGGCGDHAALYGEAELAAYAAAFRAAFPSGTPAWAPYDAGRA